MVPSSSLLTLLLLSSKRYVRGGKRYVQDLPFLGIHREYSNLEAL